MEWRVINAADYGFVQRRRRTFIFATRDASIKKNLYGSVNAGTVLTPSGFFAPAFPLIHLTTFAESSKHYDELLTLAYRGTSIVIKEASYSLNLSYNGKRTITIYGLCDNILLKTIDGVSNEKRVFYLKLGILKE